MGCERQKTVEKEKERRKGRKKQREKKRKKGRKTWSGNIFPGVQRERKKERKKNERSLLFLIHFLCLLFSFTSIFCLSPFIFLLLSLKLNVMKWTFSVSHLFNSSLLRLKMVKRLKKAEREKEKESR